MRVTREGSITFPHRGLPPNPPDGYERDSGDPFLFHPILEDCSFREIKSIKTSCCPEGVRRLFCNQLNEQVNRGICKECVLPKQAHF